MAGQFFMRIPLLLYALYHSLLHIHFFFNDTATTEIYTLSLHDALPILTAAASAASSRRSHWTYEPSPIGTPLATTSKIDRKSTRLNSGHPSISYAVFCLKKKKRYESHLQIQCPARRSPCDEAQGHSW